MTHPRKSLDKLLYSPVRLSIVSALSGVDEADFKNLRETVEITDSALSKQLAALSDAGYVKIRKTFVGKYPRTYLSLTRRGRTMLNQHLAALREIAGWSEQSP